MGNLCSISISCDAIFSQCRDCTVRKATYICELQDNLNALNNALEKLIEARNDVKTRAVIAEQQQMKRLDQVQGWLSSVQDAETAVGKLLSESSQEVDKLCLGGFCSRNCKSSYKFGKKVVKALQNVQNLKEEGDFKDVAEKIPEDPVDERPIELSIVGLQSTFDKVWRCLGENRVGIIGLYGVGGVGKTTLLTQINNKFLDTPNDVDVVIWVVVSKDLQFENIQESIGEKIGLSNESWNNKSVHAKALDIFKILSKKKFVLLLDDIWERIDLTKVGVPLPSPRNECKVVFTTREFEVCGDMETQASFKVECLGHDDAWRLFLEKVGRNVLSSHPNILQLAETIVTECGGLPLALITIGRAMASKKTPQEWEHAIQVLRTMASKFSGMEKRVYSRLKFSYDSLPSDTIRSCLLYCSLFPEDYAIIKRELIDCWVCEGILDEYDGIGARNLGHSIIGILLNACLLEENEDGNGDDCIKMHDVIRDMALWILSTSEKKEIFLVLTGVGLTEAPKVELWKEARRMSLINNKIMNLLESPTCPYILTLFLNFNRLMGIRNDFFQNMPSLTVLNLTSNLHLSKLPSGISKLISLQFLDVSYTRIEELPEELEALKNLKCFNLEHTYSLRKIPRQLISKFSALLVLRMFHSGDCIQDEDSVLFGGSEFLVEELLGLKHLNSLTITLKSSFALQEFLSSDNIKVCTQSLTLEDFKDSNMLNISCLADMKNLDILHIWECRYLQTMDIGFAGELHKVRASHGFYGLRIIDIRYCNKLRDLTWLIFAPNLKNIKISNCSDMEEILGAKKWDEVGGEVMRNLNPFSKLEFLGLENLENLKSIHRDPLSFPYLKEIRVDGCSMLKKLPLDFNSGKEGMIVIRGYSKWWDELQWEDEATQNAFSLCFKRMHQN